MRACVDSGALRMKPELRWVDGVKTPGFFGSMSTKFTYCESACQREIVKPRL